MRAQLLLLASCCCCRDLHHEGVLARHSEPARTPVGHGCCGPSAEPEFLQRTVQLAKCVCRIQKFLRVSGHAARRTSRRRKQLKWKLGFRVAAFPAHEASATNPESRLATLPKVQARAPSGPVPRSPLAWPRARARARRVEVAAGGRMALGPPLPPARGRWQQQSLWRSLRRFRTPAPCHGAAARRSAAPMYGAATAPGPGRRPAAGTPLPLGPGRPGLGPGRCPAMAGGRPASEATRRLYPTRPLLQQPALIP